MSECWTRSAEVGGEREHFGLAVYCAKRFAGRGIPMEELIGEAEAALLWAAARYDAGRGTRFSTYAIPFVLGALRELCRRNAPLHIPREELRLLCKVESLRMELRAEEGKEPTVSELGQRTGVPPEKLASMLEGQERMRSITAKPEQTAREANLEEPFENRVLWKDAVNRLGRPYAQVLWLRFFAGYSQQEIARRYQVSQGQISRWERMGRERLRQQLLQNE